MSLPSKNSLAVMFLLLKTAEQFFDGKLTVNVVQICVNRGLKQNVFLRVVLSGDVRAVRVSLAERLMSQSLLKQTRPGLSVTSISLSSIAAV